MSQQSMLAAFVEAHICVELAVLLISFRKIRCLSRCAVEASWSSLTTTEEKATVHE